LKSTYNTCSQVAKKGKNLYRIAKRFPWHFYFSHLAGSAVRCGPMYYQQPGIDRVRGQQLLRIRNNVQKSYCPACPCSITGSGCQISVITVALQLFSATCQPCLSTSVLLSPFFVKTSGWKTVFHCYLFIRLRRRKDTACPSRKGAASPVSTRRGSRLPRRKNLILHLYYVYFTSENWRG